MKLYTALLFFLTETELIDFKICKSRTKSLIFNTSRAYKEFNSYIPGVKFCLSVSLTDLSIDACISSNACRFDDLRYQQPLL